MFDSPEAAPPVPVTVTVPLLPALIWPPSVKATPVVWELAPVPPPCPVMVTGPPVDVI